MSHAKGSKARIVVGFESAFNQMPEPATGIVLPYNTTGVKVSQPLKTSGTMTGRRDPSRPYAGFTDVSGDFTAPLDGNVMGIWLKAYLGAPVTTPDAAKNISLSDAVNKGGGKVGIPVNAHGIPAGVTVTVAGTTNYNGDYQVDALSSANEIVITHAYTAESFSGGTVLPKLYTHVFKIPDELQSIWMEKQFEDIGQYELITGMKPGRMDFSVGGDSELVAKLTLMGCNALPMAQTSAVDTLTNMALARFLFDGAELYEAGVRFGRATEVTANTSAELDGGVYPVGNGGLRASLPEGVMTIGGSFKAIFESETLLNKGTTHTDTTLKLRFARAIESLVLDFEEVQFERTSVPIDTPKGLYANLNWQAFYDTGAANSALVATLRNQIASY